MPNDNAIVLSGAACHSLGLTLLDSLLLRFRHSPIVTVGRHCAEGIQEFKNVTNVEFDLNPLAGSGGFDEFAHQLTDALARALGGAAVETAFLTSGVYDWGPLVDVTVDSRKRLMGVNVCGTVELLHAIMGLNRSRGIDNSKSFTVMIVGALYGVIPTANRALYGASKAFALDLCAALQKGGEVKKAIYVAPGPIDTHMLHYNHWVYKENGPAEFFKLVSAQPKRVYEDIFLHCRDEAFASVVDSQKNRDALRAAFDRYKTRRSTELAGPRGVLAPDELSRHLVDLVSNQTSDPGAYIITAPNGELRSNRLDFSEVRYESLPEDF